jgi:hypothetical protein
MKHTPLPLALAFWVLSAAHTANAATPPANLVDCSQMSDPGERLKCYDTQMAAMKAAASPPSVSARPPALVSPPPAAVPAPATPAEAAPTAEQKFGAVGLPLATRKKVETQDDVLLSSIASIHEVHPKIWLIVLANGQTWRQEGTQITMFFRPGYDVRIEKGLFEGAFRMSTTQTGAKNWVQVSRVQ